MKKIFTLLVMAMLSTICAVAQISLGTPKWSIKDGAKVKPTGTITLSFPEATGVTQGTTVVFAGTLEAVDNADVDLIQFDGLETSIEDALEFELDAFSVEEKTNYKLTISSVKIDDTECLTGDPYVLNFVTRGSERIMSWNFALDDEIAQAIQSDGDGSKAYWSYVKSGDASRFYSVSRNNEALMLDDNTELPCAEELTFKFGNSKFYVGGKKGTKYHGQICFNANHIYMTIPGCNQGDIIKFNANRATKSSNTKFTSIIAMNSAAEALDGGKWVSGDQQVNDSIQLGSSFGDFKFKVKEEGDITFKFSNCLLKTIEITEAIEEKNCKYSVKAAYITEENDNKNVLELGDYITDRIGKTNQSVKVNYSYWMKDAEGNLYTHGTKGSEFVEKFDLVSDTTFYVSYKKTAITNVAYLAEGEDLVDADNIDSPVQLCTHQNMPVRCSNAKAAYNTQNIQLTTLPAGKYRVKAVLFDGNKTPSYICSIKLGEQQVDLAATATNFSEVESNVIVLDQASDVTWMQGGGVNNGIDCIVIYPTDDEPEPEYIVGDANSDKKVTMADANLIVNYVGADDATKAAMVDGNIIDITAADADENGDVTAEDAKVVIDLYLNQK